MSSSPPIPDRIHVNPNLPADLSALHLSSLAALVEAAGQLRAQADGSPIDNALVQAFFRSEEGYRMRGPMDTLLADDRDDLVRQAIEAGFPIEAPIGFASGSPLCSAALIGAPRCIRALAELGADMDALNDHADSPIELACSEAGELERHIACARALAECGAATGLAERGASRTHQWARKGHEPIDREAKPLGRHALSHLGREWPDVVGWAEMHAAASAAIPAAAKRMRALRDALGQSDEEFLGIPLAECLRRFELPGEIEAAWVSQEESSALASTSNAPASARRPSL